MSTLHENIDACLGRIEAGLQDSSRSVELELRVLDFTISCWEQIYDKEEGTALQEWLWIINNHVERKTIGCITYAPVCRLIQVLLSPHCPPTVKLWFQMGGYGGMSLREFVEASHGT